MHVAGITLPDAPDLVFVGGLAVVSEERCRQGAAGPAELGALLAFPAAEDAVEEATDESATAADADKSHRVCNII